MLWMINYFFLILRNSLPDIMWNELSESCDHVGEFRWRNIDIRTEQSAHSTGGRQLTATFL
jgi:hypothetical protein